MKEYRHSNRKIKELQEEIKILNKSRDFLANINETLHNNYDNAEKQLINYRKIIKYYTLLLAVINLLYNTDGCDDITRIIKCNIMGFYKKMNTDLMQIQTNDDEEFDEDSSDTWDGEEEFE